LYQSCVFASVVIATDLQLQAMRGLEVVGLVLFFIVRALAEIRTFYVHANDVRSLIIFSQQLFMVVQLFDK